MTTNFGPDDKLVLTNLNKVFWPEHGNLACLLERLGRAFEAKPHWQGFLNTNPTGVITHTPAFVFQGKPT